MAERRNYYEIIDKLSFDPIEMKEKNIVNAIDLWKLLEDKRGVSSEDANGEQRQQELDMYEEIKACLTNKESRKAEAEAMKQKQLRKLDAIISVLKECQSDDGLYVSNARIRSIAISLRLDGEKTVKKAFVNAGFEVIVRKNVNVTSILLPNTMFNKVSESIAVLSSMNSKDYPWLGQVKSLYDLAAYFGNDGDNAKEYNSKPASELKAIMEAGAASVAGKLDPLNHCFADLFQAGATQIFKDDASKVKYDNSLNILLLKPFFDVLKEMPSEMKRDSYIAELCINKLQQKKSFADADIARAIYNQQVGNILDPYEPDSGDVNIMCGSCKGITKYKYGSEKTSCKCQVCGSPLFVKCSKCGVVIPSIADICPECGFNLVESKFFDRYCALARSALDSMDIAEARKQLSLAKSARPQDPALKSLEQEISVAIDKYEKPLQVIRNLINQSKYMEASKMLSSFCSKYPGVKIDDLKNQIESTIREADKMFASLSGHSDPCGVCFDILDKISDYEKARDYIKDKKPVSVKGLSATVSTKSNQISIRWDGTGEREVNYCVVRKENSKPQSINDGTVIMKNKLVTQFVDSDIKAGTLYYYAVYAYRLGTYSEGSVSGSCILFQELDETKIISNAEDKRCVMSWQLPSNCRGVRILRCDSGRVSTEVTTKTQLISDCSLNGFEDASVINGLRYEYRLQCLYNVDGGIHHSDGIVISLVPDSKPQQVELVSVLVKSENSVQVSWTHEKELDNSILDIYDIVSGIKIVPGTTYHITELTKIGKKIGTISTPENKTAELRIDQKKGYRICIAVTKGNYAVISNCLSFSNFDKVQIDKSKTKITGGNLVLNLIDNFPASLTNIRYSVATKNSDSETAPWCCIEDAPSMTQLSKVAYINDGMIKIGKVPEKELYISVIGEYVVGKDVFYSEPSKLRLSNRPKIEIKYRLVWGLLSKKKNVKLVVECDSDAELPEMILCCNKTIKVPMSAKAPNSIMLCKVPENQNYKAHNKIEVDIKNDVWSLVTRGNEIRLFIPEDDYSEFRMAPEISSLKIP